MYVAGYVVKNDSFFYVSQFGCYLQEVNRDDLKISGDLICQWVIYCYVTFLQSASDTCRSSFGNLARIIFDMYNFSVGRFQLLSSVSFVNCIPHAQVKSLMRSFSNYVADYNLKHSDVNCKFFNFERFLVDCKTSLFSKTYMHSSKVNLESVVDGATEKCIYSNLT